RMEKAGVRDGRDQSTLTGDRPTCGTCTFSTELKPSMPAMGSARSVLGPAFDRVRVPKMTNSRPKNDIPKTTANKMSMSMDCLGCAAKSSRGLAVRQLVACNLYPTPEQKSISNWPVSHADLFGRPLPRGMSGGPLLQFTKLTSTRSQRLLQ